RVFVILLCCCGTVVFGSTSKTAAPDSFGWVQLSPPNSPPARSYLAMTYDAASGKIIVFGGFGGEYLNDTWAFDGVSWTQIATSVAPSPRTNAQMAYDSVTHKVVLYGGYNGASYLGDTWLWDGATSQWAPVRTAHRPPAVTGPMVFADPNGHADLYGGFDG